MMAASCYSSVNEQRVVELQISSAGGWSFDACQRLAADQTARLRPSRQHCVIY